MGTPVRNQALIAGALSALCMALILLPGRAALAAAVPTLPRVVDTASLGASPGRMALSPAEDHLYATAIPCCYEPESLGVFERDPGTGSLTLVQTLEEGVGGVTGLQGPTDVAVSPDGKHVYVTARDAPSVALFDRDAVSGFLTFVEAVYNGVDGVEGLGGAARLRLSSDGANVYVASRDDSALVVFDRDSATGALTFVEVHVHEVDGVVGLFGADDVVFSPDEKHVYVPGSFGSSIGLFERDPSDGTLTFLSAASEIPLGTRRLALSPDGLNAYVSIFQTSILHVFSRDPVSGLFTFLESHDQGRSFPGALAGGLVVVSPDGGDVYVTALGSSLAQFQRQLADGRLVYVGNHHNPSVSARPLFTSGGEFFYVGAPGGEIATMREEPVCPELPEDGCAPPRTAERERLTIKDKDGGKADRLVWKFARGDETLAGDLGNPTEHSNYALCLYDASAAPQPLLSLRAPGGDVCTGVSPNVGVLCWKGDPEVGTRYSYKDVSGLSPDGVAGLKLRAGDPGRSALSLKARGGAKERLDLPALPLTAPLRVQLRNLDTGACWETIHEELKRNTDTQVKG